MNRISTTTAALMFGLLWTTSCSEPEEAPAPPAPVNPSEAEADTAGAAGAAGNGSTEPELPAWRFMTVEGKVTLNGQAAREEMAIGATDTIETGPASRAVVTLGPGSAIEIREKAKVTLGSSARKKISARVLLGQVWSFFDQPADYEVVTANAIAGVRGTVFFVDASSKKQTIFCACSHAVHFQSLDAKKPPDQEVEAKEWEHIGFMFARKGKKVITKKLGSVSNPPSHPDEAGKEIFAAIPH